ncbi:33 kDa chaperonin [Philodulcilactobacillus myokoensis]|uniref:33 kDa chaperonin n=1 Tax=Philodulcilactobacillus myokoensis TaxID=2929573 RepID=A0A9W6ETE4_9LACO|nr:Hsp33 family molecular chaperone HslO [Philodulcilactobacillus myokoensis]GLB47198.1 33 kDa chaperonin [Philodulcilactobacillus myokoensis]
MTNKHDHLVKSISNDGMFRAYSIDATNIVSEAKRRHHTSDAVTEALGRSLIGGVLLSSSVIKGRETMTIKIDGRGPVGLIIIDADANGNVKGYIQHPKAKVTSDSNGNIDVGKVVGKNGYMQVIKSQGGDEPYTSNVELVSGQIGDDFTYYLAQSEQIPSAIDVSVKLNQDGSVEYAGGYLVQKMPGASGDAIEKLENHLKMMPGISKLMSNNQTPADILKQILGSKNTKILSKTPTQFKCNCSKKRFANDIAGLNPNDIKQMINEDHGADVTCNFCGNHYHYSEDELKAILILADSKKHK